MLVEVLEDGGWVGRAGLPGAAHVCFLARPRLPVELDDHAAFDLHRPLALLDASLDQHVPLRALLDLRLEVVAPHRLQPLVGHLDDARLRGLLLLLGALSLHFDDVGLAPL